jgi:hypothetical protein
MALLSTSSVMAADIGYRYDNTINKVVISGSLDGGKERISIQIYNKGAFDLYAPDAAVDKENLDNVLVYSAQGYTSENGEFSFSFPLDEPSGSYIARVGSASMTKAIDYGFYYTSPDEETEILAQLKSKKTAQELMRYVEGDTPEAIGIFNPDPSYGIIKDKIAVYQRIINDNGYESLADFSALFVQYTRLQEINEINNTNELLRKLVEYNSLSGIEEEPFYNETYADVLTVEQKNEVMTSVMDHSDFNSFEEMNRYMGEQTILCAIKYNDWSVVQEVMNTNESFFTDTLRKKFTQT